MGNSYSRLLSKNKQRAIPPEAPSPPAPPQLLPSTPVPEVITSSQVTGVTDIRPPSSNSPQQGPLPQLPTPPNIPYDVPLRMNWRMHVRGVPLGPGMSRYIGSAYMRVDIYGNSIDQEVFFLHNLALYCQMAVAFPHFITLFLDGTWTTRLRQVTFLPGSVRASRAGVAVGIGVDASNEDDLGIEAEGVLDPHGRICWVTGVRFREGHEEICALPLDGSAPVSSSTDGEWHAVDRIRRCLIP